MTETTLIFLCLLFDKYLITSIDYSTLDFYYFYYYYFSFTKTWIMISEVVRLLLQTALRANG